MSSKTAIMYGIKNCDTIKKARQWLEDNGVEYNFHDYKKEGISPEKLIAWIDNFGWENVVNRKGTSWRSLSEELRNSADKNSAIQLMIENPSLIKRPIIETSGENIIGFNPSEYKEIFTL